MSITPTEYIWRDGELIPWADATEHVMAHAMHYGTSVFEGIRAYSTPKGPAIFRLKEHVRRLFDSAKMYHIEIRFTQKQICEACLQVVGENQLNAAYIRPLVYAGMGELGLIRTEATPIKVIVAAIPWGALHGSGSIENGIDACVSSWQRATSASTPLLAKAGGHYLNSQLITMEANRNGFAEGIAVINGSLSEGAGENIFLVRDDVIYTPPLASSILNGITRNTAIQLAAQLGVPLIQQAMPREMLYIADEVFMTGTAAEITPVRSIDRITIGESCPGPVTRQLQKSFFGLFNGETDPRDWLSYVPQKTTVN